MDCNLQNMKEKGSVSQYFQLPEMPKFIRNLPLLWFTEFHCFFSVLRNAPVSQVPVQRTPLITQDVRAG